MTVKEWADGLRAMADWAEANPELMARASGVEASVVYVDGLGDLEAATAFTRSLPRPVSKEFSDQFFRVRASFGPHSLRYAAWRSNVCEKIVTEVTEEVEVPDPEALAAVPTITETRTREVVEWKCPDSLLEDA